MSVEFSHEWPGLEAQIEGIFTRRFYANHGPLESAAEQAIANAADRQYAAIVTNDTFALILALRAVASSGKVFIAPAAPTNLLNAICWAGLDAAVDDSDFLVDAPTICVATLGKPPGEPATCDETVVHVARQLGIPLIWNVLVGNFDVDADASIRSRFADQDITVLSFAEQDGGTTVHCGAVATNDEMIWKRVRTMRSFHESESLCEGCLRFNGKASELQAALVLSMLTRGG